MGAAYLQQPVKGREQQRRVRGLGRGQERRLKAQPRVQEVESVEAGGLEVLLALEVLVGLQDVDALIEDEENEAEELGGGLEQVGHQSETWNQTSCSVNIKSSAGQTIDYLTWMLAHSDDRLWLLLVQRLILCHVHCTVGLVGLGKVRRVRGVFVQNFGEEFQATGGNLPAFPGVPVGPRVEPEEDWYLLIWPQQAWVGDGSDQGCQVIDPAALCGVTLAV